MIRLFRRLLYCRRGQHREALAMHRWRTAAGVLTAVTIHRLSWRCVDCGRDEYLIHSDNLGSNRRATA